MFLKNNNLKIFASFSATPLFSSYIRHLLHLAQLKDSLTVLQQHFMPSCLAKLGRVGCARPAKMPLEEAREVIDEIKNRVLRLIERINRGHRKRKYGGV